ncbi:MAG: PilZ domain-containing protein [Candidatus Omnitrophica bacterium]|nr:PilZ domain-containing protein [Candidatus Omnitrophota bacterium]
MRERRKYVRSDGLVLVNYKIPNLHLEGKSSAFDIGENGVRITVEKELKVDTPLEMEIYLPGSSQPIMAKGEVVWAQKCKEKLNIQQAPKKEYFYAGIKFTVIDENSKNRIVNYVHHKIHQAK